MRALHLCAFLAAAFAQDAVLVVRKECATSCGRLVPEGWTGPIDASQCTTCTCSSGAFGNCRAAKGCLSSTRADVPECLEEDDACSGLKEFCPEGTECTDVKGVARCVQTATSVCANTQCDAGLVCKVSQFGTPLCKKGCEKTCGGFVPHGWSGKDDGNNQCNTCWCNNGVMSCTRMLCFDGECPSKCTPYTPEKKCFLTPVSPAEFSLELAKPAVGALTFRRLCYNAATCRCGFYPQVFCFQNPCNTVSCKAGYHCEANYCGGCNHMCVKDKCPPRVRKAWSTLPCAERKLYVRAVKAHKLANPAEYDDFVAMHLQAWNYAHSSQEFFPWHRWYLVGYENALRALGGEFECITIPYWDWEKDAGKESTSSPLRCDTFGRSSATTATGCVTEGIADFPSWKVTGGGCLERTFGSFGFSGEASLLAHITTKPSYSVFRPAIEGSPHVAPHVYVGGHMGSGTSPEDPLFMIHHCNVDRLWALWQDYHGYDEVAKGSYTDTHYYTAANLGNVIPMDVDGTGRVLSYFSTPVTLRDMMHLHDMPAGNDYSYGEDSLAFTLGSPAAGTWSWVTPGSLPAVNCFSLCNKWVVPPVLVQPIWFRHPELELKFKATTCDARDDNKAEKVEIFRELAHFECDMLAEKPTASEEWIKMMWRDEDTAPFERCWKL